MLDFQIIILKCWANFWQISYYLAQVCQADYLTVVFVATWTHNSKSIRCVIMAALEQELKASAIEPP